MKERCTFRPFCDPNTLEPRGPQCQAYATHRIEWRDGRVSYGCNQHGMKILTKDARRLVAAVVDISEEEP